MLEKISPCHKTQFYINHASQLNCEMKQARIFLNKDKLLTSYFKFGWFGHMNKCNAKTSNCSRYISQLKTNILTEFLECFYSLKFEKTECICLCENTFFLIL